MGVKGVPTTAPDSNFLCHPLLCTMVLHLYDYGCTCLQRIESDFHILPNNVRFQCLPKLPLSCIIKYHFSTLSTLNVSVKTLSCEEMMTFKLRRRLC